LGSADLEAGTYSDVTLILDYDQDENGNAPGVYVQTTDNVKHALKTSGNVDSVINVTGDFVVDEKNSNESVVIDFDLRKSIRYTSSGSTSNYQLVSDNDLDAVARLITKEDAGTIEGDFMAT